MSAVNKETIYIDADDEITSIIEKIKNSRTKIIALVLPKRATVLQSVVNMKLLKRAADSSKKNLVLITSESGLLPLAGAAGIHVAKSLQSKPLIPPSPQSDYDEGPEIINDNGKKINVNESIGTLAASAAVGDDETETIELDNVEVKDEAVNNATKATIAGKLKHLKVPNFEKFRLGFFLAGLALILLIVGWYMAFIVMPKANITIKTDTTTVVSSFDFTASTDVKELDMEAKKLPATLKEVKKTDTEKAQATGQKDVGGKATGELKIYNCSKEDKLSDTSRTVPANTAVSINGLTFMTTEAGTVEPSSFVGNTCSKNKSTTVEVIAQESGDKYNIGARTGYTISGFTNMSGDGSDMGGGTTKIVKIVSQTDIDAAKDKMAGRPEKQAVDEIKGLFDADNLYALPESKLASVPKITVAPALNQEATEFTVTSETNYSMLGIKRDDLSSTIKKDVEDEIDTEKQAITNDGIDTGIMRLNNQPNNKEAFISFRTSVIAGPELDIAALKESVKGKKRGEIESSINAQPGVTEVIVEYSPFWVYSTPKATKKINIVVEKTENTETNNQEANESE